MADLRASGLGGVPKGTTADRPSSPSIGDVFYNGTLGCLEIYTSQGWVASSAPPAVPTSIVATNQPSNRAYNNGQMSVAFTNGAGGGFIDQYIVTPSPATSPSTFTGSSSPITITGLSSSTQYTYTVQASNNFGTSLSSAASSAVTATTVPQAPSITAVNSQNGGSAIITITPNANGGSAITEYSIVSNPATTTQTTSSTSYEFTGLTNGTSYTFTAQAINSNGYSLASSPTDSVVINGVSVADVLIVAGGGGGSDATAYGGRGGAGGAGGLLYYGTETPKTPNGSALNLIVGTTYNITVGGGGVRSTYSGSPVVYTGQGVNSTFDSYTALGGGYGGPNDSPYGDGGNGGSGGGSWYFGNGGSGTPGQGNNGGGNATQPNYGGGGGGGAGAAGGNGTTSAGGNGGNGLQYSITGSAVYYAGGGSASTYGPTGNFPGTAGLGGGGTGSNTNNSVANAAINTGGGGGMGGLGGSGVVIVRTSKVAASTTGSPIYTNPSTGVYVYQFNNNGSITF